MECLKTDYLEVWAAGERPAGCVLRTVPGPSLPRASICSVLPNRRGPYRGASRVRFHRFLVRRQSPGVPRSWLPRWGCRVTFFPALPPGGAGIHATDFYLEQARGITDVHKRRHSAHPLRRCTRGFRGDPPVFRQSGEELAAREVPGAGAETGAHDAGPLVRRSGRSSAPQRVCARIADLYDLACWLASARLYIGNDSGITHLAAAAGAPVLALFGPTDPAVWAPRGPNVRVGRWKEREEDVVAAARALQ